MTRINVTTNTTLKLKVRKDKNCKSCNGNYEYLSGKKGSRIIKICGANSYQIKGRKINLPHLIKKLRSSKIAVSDFRSCIHLNNLTIFKDGRALVKAKSPEQAKSIYSRIVG